MFFIVKEQLKPSGEQVRLLNSKIAVTELRLSH